ncbi:MAG: arginine--tRNA ligase [Candidatus Berkelbacteria bacterium]|nr:arginine--tRNA ligase [Candidatus Berkelbacteria bacterium]
MVKGDLKQLVEKAVKKAYSNIKIPDFDIEYPKEASFGDYSCSVAMQIASIVKKPPLEIAQKIINNLEAKFLKKIELAPPGFINFYLNEEWVLDKIDQIIQEKDKFGSQNVGKGKKVQVEFISANPTGPLHIGNARGGPIGDVLASVLEKSGFNVKREFYVNDVGNQVEKFGQTIMYWYLKKKDKSIPFPEDGYQGDYVQKIAHEIKDPKIVSTEYFAKVGIKKMMQGIKKDCLDMGIRFDNYIYESEIIKKDKTTKVISDLIKKGMAREKDGALWFCKKGEEQVLEDKEYVLLRSDPRRTPTYFTNDLAYHIDKVNRGFDQVIDVLGANTYGHIQKMMLALETLGITKDWLRIVLYQFVRLKKGDNIEKMSKRQGTYVTARQVLDEVPKDVFRFMMLQKSPGTHLDFDLKLAKDKSEENPVYYIQYANARIHGILAKSKAQYHQLKAKTPNYKLLVHSAELQLAKQILKFPEIIEEITRSYQVQKLAFYTYEVAVSFHNFYEKCKVIDKKNPDLTTSRIALIQATQIVLTNALGILGIKPLSRM